MKSRDKDLLDRLNDPQVLEAFEKLKKKLKAKDFNQEKVASNVRILCVLRKMSKSKLAKQAGYSHAFLSLWMRGKKPLTANCLFRVAQLLRVKVSILLEVDLEKVISQAIEETKTSSP